MTSAHRHLTRSRFKLGMECPAKLPFTGKDRDANRICANANLEDALPAAWGKEAFCSKNSRRQKGVHPPSVGIRCAQIWLELEASKEPGEILRALQEHVGKNPGAFFSHKPATKT